MASVAVPPVNSVVFKGCTELQGSRVLPKSPGKTQVYGGSGTLVVIDEPGCMNTNCARDDARFTAIDSVIGELKTANVVLRADTTELKAANVGLKAAVEELKVSNVELKAAVKELTTSNVELKAANVAFRVGTIRISLRQVVQESETGFLALFTGLQRAALRFNQIDSFAAAISWLDNTTERSEFSTQLAAGLGKAMDEALKYATEDARRHIRKAGTGHAHPVLPSFEDECAATGEPEFEKYPDAAYPAPAGTENASVADAKAVVGLFRAMQRSSMLAAAGSG